MDITRACIRVNSDDFYRVDYGFATNVRWARVMARVGAGTNNHLATVL